MMADASNKQ